ncbi:MAG: hypothetical protein WA160_07215 [Pseudobdellovibrio sp.]
MKQNVMNQTVILGPNENEWLIANPLWKSWRLKVYEVFMKLALGSKQVWQTFAGLWLLRALGNLIRGIGCILFVAPPEQQKIEQARMQAMQYRNIF